MWQTRVSSLIHLARFECRLEYFGVGCISSIARAWLDVERQFTYMYTHVYKEEYNSIISLINVFVYIVRVLNIKRKNNFEYWIILRLKNHTTKII